MKYLKLFENTTQEAKTYWLLEDPGTDYYDDVTYLFDNEKELLNFTMNKVYNNFKQNFKKEESDQTLEEHLSILDDCNDSDEVIEFLNDAIDNDILGDYDTRFNLSTTILNENIYLEEWIELRRAGKKYNL